MFLNNVVTSLIKKYIQKYVINPLDDCVKVSLSGRSITLQNVELRPLLLTEATNTFLECSVKLIEIKLPWSFLYTQRCDIIISEPRLIISSKKPDVSTITQESFEQEVSESTSDVSRGYIQRLIKSIIQNTVLQLKDLKLTIMNASSSNENALFVMEVDCIQCVKEENESLFREENSVSTPFAARRVSFIHVDSYVIWKTEKVDVLSVATVDVDVIADIERREFCIKTQGTPIECHISIPLVSAANSILESFLFFRQCCVCPCVRPENRPTRGDKQSIRQWWLYGFWLSKSLKKSSRNKSIWEGLEELKKEMSCYHYYLWKFKAPWYYEHYQEPPLVSYVIHRKCSREASFAIRHYHDTGTILSYFLAGKMSTSIPTKPISEWNLLFSYNGDIQVGGIETNVKFLGGEIGIHLNNERLDRFSWAINEITLCNNNVRTVISSSTSKKKCMSSRYYPNEDPAIYVSCSPLEIQATSELVQQCTAFCHSAMVVYSGSSWSTNIPIETSKTTAQKPLVLSVESVTISLDETVFITFATILGKDDGISVEEVSVEVENLTLLKAFGISISAVETTLVIQKIRVANQLDGVERVKDKLAMVATSLSSPSSPPVIERQSSNAVPFYVDIRIKTIAFESISVHKVMVSIEASQGWYIVLSALGVSSHSSSCPNANVSIQMWADDYVSLSPFGKNVDSDGIAFLILCSNADLIIDDQLVGWIEILYDLIMLILFQAEDSHVYLHDVNNTVHHISGSIRIGCATLTLEQCCDCTNNSNIPAVVIKAREEDSAVISVQRASDKSVKAQIVLHDTVTASLRDIEISAIELLPFRQHGTITVSVQLHAPPVGQVEIFPFSRLKIDIDINGRAVVPHLPTVMALWHHFDVSETSVNRLRNLPSRMHFGSRHSRNRAPPLRSANSSFFFRTGSACMERIGVMVSPSEASKGIYSPPIFPIDLVLRVNAVGAVLYYPWNESDESHCSTPMYFFAPVHRFRLLLTSREGLTRLDLSGMCDIPRVRCSTAGVPKDDPCHYASFRGVDGPSASKETAVAVKLVYTHDKRSLTLARIKAVHTKELDSSGTERQTPVKSSKQCVGNAFPMAKEDLFLSISGWDREAGGKGKSSLDGICGTLSHGELAAYATLLTAQRTLNAWRLPGYQPNTQVEPRRFSFQLHVSPTVILVPCIGLGVVLWNGFKFKIDLSTVTRSHVDIPRLSCFVHESISQETLLSTFIPSPCTPNGTKMGNVLYAFQRMEEQGFAVLELRGKDKDHPDIKIETSEPSFQRYDFSFPSYHFSPPVDVSSAFNRVSPWQVYGETEEEVDTHHHPITLWHVHTAVISITEKVLFTMGKIRALYYLERLQQLVEKQKKAVEALGADGKMRWEELHRETCSRQPSDSGGSVASSKRRSRNLVVIDSVVLRVVWLTMLQTKKESLAGIIARFQSVIFGEESAVLLSQLPEAEIGQPSCVHGTKDRKCSSTSPRKRYGSPRRWFPSLHRQGSVCCPRTTTERRDDETVRHQRMWSEATTSSLKSMSTDAVDPVFSIAGEECEEFIRASHPEQVLLLRQGDVSLILVEPTAERKEDWGAVFLSVTSPLSSGSHPQGPGEKLVNGGTPPSVQLIPLLHPFCIEPEVVSLPPLKKVVFSTGATTGGGNDDDTHDGARQSSQHTSLISKLSRLHVELTTTTYLFLYEAHHRLQELIRWNRQTRVSSMCGYIGVGNGALLHEVLSPGMENPDGFSLDTLLSKIMSRSGFSYVSLKGKEEKIWPVDEEDTDYFTCEKLEDEEEMEEEEETEQDVTRLQEFNRHSTTHYLGLYIEEIRFTLVELMNEEERERDYWKWLSHACIKEREELILRWSVLAHNTLESPQLPVPDLQFDQSFYGACDVLGLSLHPSEMDADNANPLSRQPSVKFRTVIKDGISSGSVYFMESGSSSPREFEAQEEFGSHPHMDEAEVTNLNTLEENDDPITKPDVTHCHSVELIMGPIILLQDQCPLSEATNENRDEMDQRKAAMVSVVGIHLESIVFHVDHNSTPLLDLKKLYWHIDGSTSTVQINEINKEIDECIITTSPSQNRRNERYTSPNSNESPEMPRYSRKIIGAVEGLDVTLDPGALATVVELLVERPARTLAEIYRNANLAASKKKNLSSTPSDLGFAFYDIPGIGASAMYLHCITGKTWSLEEDLFLSRQHPQGQLLFFSNADTNHLTVHLNQHRLCLDASISSSSSSSTYRNEHAVMVVEEGLTVTFIGGVIQLPFQAFIRAQAQCTQRGIDPSDPESPLCVESLLFQYVILGKGSYISCKDIRVVFSPDVEASRISSEEARNKAGNSSDNPLKGGRKQRAGNHNNHSPKRKDMDTDGLFDEVGRTIDGMSEKGYWSMEVHHFSVRLRTTVTSSLRYTQSASLVDFSTNPAKGIMARRISPMDDTKDSPSLLVTGVFQADCCRHSNDTGWDRRHIELSTIAIRTVHANPLRDWSTADTVIIENWSLDGLYTTTPSITNSNAPTVREDKKPISSERQSNASRVDVRTEANVKKEQSSSVIDNTTHFAVDVGEVNAEITYQDVTLITALVQEFASLQKAKKNMTCSTVEREFRQFLEEAIKWEQGEESGNRYSVDELMGVSRADLHYAHDETNPQVKQRKQSWSYFSHNSAESNGNVKRDIGSSPSEFSMVIVVPKFLLCLSNHRSPLLSVAADLIIGKSILHSYDQMKQESVQISGLSVRVFGKGSWDNVISPPTARLTWSRTLLPLSQHVVVKLDAVQITSSLLILSKIHNIQQQIQHFSHLVAPSNSTQQYLDEIFEMRVATTQNPLGDGPSAAGEDQQVPPPSFGALITPCTSQSYSEKADGRAEKEYEDMPPSGQRTPPLRHSNVLQFGSESVTTHCFTNALDKAFYLLFFPLPKCVHSTTHTIIPATASIIPPLPSLPPQVSKHGLSEPMQGNAKCTKRMEYKIPTRLSLLSQYEIVEVPPMNAVNLSIPYKRGSEMYVCLLPKRCVRQSTTNAVSNYHRRGDLLQSNQSVTFLLNKEEVASLDPVIAGVMLGELQYGASKGLVVDQGVIVLSCTEDDDLSTYLARGNVVYAENQWKDLSYVNREENEDNPIVNSATECQEQPFHSSLNEISDPSVDDEPTSTPTASTAFRHGFMTEKTGMTSQMNGKPSSDIIHIRIHAKTTLRNETGMSLWLSPQSLIAEDDRPGYEKCTETGRDTNNGAFSEERHHSPFTKVSSGAYYPVYGACNTLRIRVHLAHRIYETILPLQSTSNSSFLTLSPLPDISPTPHEYSLNKRNSHIGLLRDNRRDNRPLVFYVVVALVANHTSTDIVLLPRLTVINSLGVPVRLTLWQFDARAGPPTLTEKHVKAAWCEAHRQTMPFVGGAHTEHRRTARQHPPLPPDNLVLLGAHHALPHEGALCVSQCTYASNLYIGISFNQPTGEWVGTPDGQIVQITTDLRRSAGSAGAFPIIVPLQQRSGRRFHLLVTIRPRTIVLSVAMWVCNMTNYPLLLSDHWITRKLVSGVDESCGVAPAQGSPLLLGVLLHRFDHAFMRIGFDGEWSGAFSTTIGASGIIESRCPTLQVTRSCNYTVYFPNGRAHQPAILLITPRWVFCNLTSKRLRVHLDYPGLAKAKKPALKQNKNTSEGHMPSIQGSARTPSTPNPLLENEETVEFSGADRRRMRKEAAALAEERAEVERANLVSSMATVYLKPNDFYASCVGPASGNRIFLQEDLEGVIPSVEVLDENGSFLAEHNVVSYYEAQRTDALSVDSPGEVLFNLWAVPNPPQRQLATWDGVTVTAYPSDVVPHPLARERRRREALDQPGGTPERIIQDGRVLTTESTLEDGAELGVEEEAEGSLTSPSSTSASSFSNTSSMASHPSDFSCTHRNKHHRHHATPHRQVPSLTLFDPHSALDAAVTGRLAVGVSHSHDNVLVVSIRPVVSTQICVHNRTLHHTVVVRQQGSVRRSGVPSGQNRYFSWEEASGEHVLLVHLLGCKGAWYVVDLNRGECEICYHELESEGVERTEGNFGSRRVSDTPSSALFHVMALTNPSMGHVTIVVTTEPIPAVARHLFSSLFSVAFSSSSSSIRLSSPSFSRMTLIHLSAISIVYRLVDNASAEKVSEASNDAMANRVFSLEEEGGGGNIFTARKKKKNESSTETEQQQDKGEEDSASGVVAFTLLLHGFTLERLDAGNMQNFRVAIDVAQLLVQRGEENPLAMMYRAIPAPPSSAVSNYRKAVMMALLSRLRNSFARPHLLEGRYNLVRYPDGMKRLTEGSFYLAPLVLELSDLDLAQWLIEGHAVQRFMRSLTVSQRQHYPRYTPAFLRFTAADTPSFSPAVYLSNVMEKLKEGTAVAIEGIHGGVPLTDPSRLQRGAGESSVTPTSRGGHSRHQRAGKTSQMAIKGRHHLSRSTQNDPSEVDHFILVDRLRVDRFSLFLSFRRDPSDPLRPLLGPYTLMLPNATDHTEFSLHAFALDFRVETMRSLQGKLRQWCRNGLREQWTKITKLGTLLEMLKQSGQPPLEPRPVPLTLEEVRIIQLERMTKGNDTTPQVEEER